jgi:hypothetical protein
VEVYAFEAVSTSVLKTITTQNRNDTQYGAAEPNATRGMECDRSQTIPETFRTSVG